MEKNDKQTKFKVGDPGLHQISMEKVADSVFRCQLLDSKYCADLCGEIKRSISSLQTPNIERIEASIFGLDQVVSKIVDALVPSLPIDKADQKLVRVSSAYITINKAIRPSHKLFRTNAADFIVDVNLGEDFTGGELIWLHPDSYAIEAQEAQSAGKALIYTGNKLQGARAVLSGERVNLMIELKRLYSFPQFNELSPELKRYLLRFLDVKGLCALSQTCHEMKSMVYAADSEWAIPEEDIFNRADLVKTFPKKIVLSDTQLSKLIQEIVFTEKTYAEYLKYLNEHAFAPIFAAVPDLNIKYGVTRVAVHRMAEAHEKIASDLQLIHAGEAGYEEFSMISLCTIYSSLLGALPCYLDYIAQYNTLLEIAKLNDKKISGFLKEFREQDPRKLSLEGYLVMPVSRLPRYNLLFTQIKRNINTLQNGADVEKALDQLLASIIEASSALNTLFHVGKSDSDKDIEEVAKMVKKSSGSCIIL